MKLASLEQKNAVVLNPDQLKPLKLHDSSQQLIQLDPFQLIDRVLEVIYLPLIGINRINFILLYRQPPSEIFYMYPNGSKIPVAKIYTELRQINIP